MVPRILKTGCEGDGTCQGCPQCEHGLLANPSRWAPDEVGQLSREELELGFQRERRKQRYRTAALCCGLLIVATACSIAAYQYGWSSWSSTEEWRSYDGMNHLELKGQYQPLKEHVMYIGIMSPPRNFKQRTAARLKWVDKMRKEYAGRVKIKFLIGQVPIDGNFVNIPGQVVAGSKERILEERLQDEERSFGDISRIPVVESHEFRTDKALWVLRKGVSWKARFVIKANDQQEVSIENTLATLQKRSPVAAPTYFGKVWTMSTTKEADGEKSWHYRQCYGVSGDLAHRISSTHMNHTIGYPRYGSSSEDVNVAKWVKFEDKIRVQHGFLPVRHLWLPSLCNGLRPNFTGVHEENIPSPPPV